MQTDHDINVNVFDEQKGSILKMQLSDVVIRGTAGELPDGFEMEAVKALAVAIRTTVVKRLRMFDGTGCEIHRGADICTHMKGCRYVTDLDLLKETLGDRFEKYYSMAERAAEETSSIIITCGKRPILAEYHITCGGGTENSEDVLGNSIMYFRKVLCSYCSASPYWENFIDVPVDKLEDLLKVKTMKESGIWGPGMEGIIDGVERDETGRVRKIRIGGKAFTGTEIKKLLGFTSSRFGWDPIVIRFRVRGTGDGLGMCLYGANTMAKEGKGYSDILNYYYTNINIEHIDTAGEGVPLKGKVFVLDPGHGGEGGDDERGPSGLREKDVNLYIARRLAEYLEKSGAKVIYTRDSDTETSLQARVEMVNSIRPNFFIGIHQNAFFSPSVSGTLVYCFRGDHEGERLGRAILENIVKGLGTINRGCKYADLYSLRESKVSAVVIECMHISNPQEEQRLKDDGVKGEIAASIYRGLMDYYGI